MLNVYRTTRLPGGSRFEHFEGSVLDAIKRIFEDWVECRGITVVGSNEITLEGYTDYGIPWTVAIEGPQADMAPLIYLIGLYFEQLALITELNDRGKHQLVLLTCCEAFGLDWQEFIPKGWPEISQHIDAWLEEFSALQNT